MNPKLSTLLIMPEGPIAFDGKNYRYSKGERKYIDDLCKEFKKVILLTLVFRKNDPDYSSCTHSKFVSKNLKVVELNQIKKSKFNFFDKFYQLINTFKVSIKPIKDSDISYLFLPSYHSAIGWIVSKLLFKKHIVYGADDWYSASHAMFKWDKSRNKFSFFIFSNLNKILERLIVSSSKFSVVAGGQLLKKYKGYGTNTFLTSPRMTLSMDDIFKKDDTCQNKEISIIAIGALVKDKNYSCMLKAVKEISKYYNNFKLKIIGQGILRESLKDEIDSLGINKYVFLEGFIEDEKILYAHLKKADIFMLSSNNEGFPRVLYESMAMSLPIVTTRAGGIPFLLKDRFNAILTPIGDYKLLSKGCLEIIKNKQLRKNLIKNGRKTVEKIISESDSRQIPKLVKIFL